MSCVVERERMRPGFLDKIDITLTGEEVIEWLNRTSYDDLIDIDIANDRCLNLYHVEGKYYVPSLDGSYSEIFEYAIEHMIHPDDREVYRQYMTPSTMLDVIAQAESPGCVYFKIRYKLQNGAWRWVGKYLFAGSEYGIREGAVLTYTFDIQSQIDRQQGGALDDYFAKESQEERNAITRLIGEKAFYAQARRLFLRPDIAEWCVIAIDIQYFRLLNDWYGRTWGDLLLARMGELLTEAEQESGGVAAHFGQDDFYLITPYDQQSITRLHRKMAKLFADLHTSYGFRPLFGVCRIDPEVHILDLLDHAQEALQLSRQDVKMDICLYESKMQQQTGREYEILLEFKNGIRDREFKPFLQPQCRIPSGKIVGAEALARWCKPDGSVISPSEFIPVLEKYGFITDLDCFIWEEVCALLRSWIDKGLEVVPISVNVSQADFYAIDVPEFIDSLTRKYGIPKSLLEIEVTESTFANNVKTVIGMTQRLRDLGFTLLMDDFGSGSSSLHMLSSLNVDVIKLDGGFFRNSYEHIRKSGRIIESIVGMAHNLELFLITEGVETREQVEFLEGMGCHFIQGFYFYKPMPVDEFEQLISSGEQIDGRGLSRKSNEQLGVREFLNESLYSDTMLNSILGAVAFCTRHENRFDIVRFNEQFYKMMDIPNFEEIMHDFQEKVIERDREKLISLFDKAESDLLNGALGIVGYKFGDGFVRYYEMRLFYQGEKEESKLFYTSAKDVTDRVQGLVKSQIMSKYYPHSIVFLGPREDNWNFLVAIHGLGSALGFTQDDMQREFDDGSFLARLKPGVFEQARLLAVKAMQDKTDFELDIDVMVNDGQFVPLHMKAEYIDYEFGDITHILTFSLQEE